MAGTGKIIDESAIEKKFANAKNTQESIQSIAMWAIHHKNQHSKVVEMWLEVMKNSKPSRRVTLFYICNEIVQTCKRKRATPYKESFQLILPDATALVRDASVRNSIERIFTIWLDRGVFEADYVDQLMATLTQTGDSTKSRSSSAVTTNTKVQTDTSPSATATVTAIAATSILEEFKPSVLREQVAHVAQYEKDIELKRRRLNVHSIDELSQKLSKHTKDRNHSKLYSQQVEDIHKNLTDYMASVQSEMTDRQHMIELLEQSELFYEVQYGEAKIVANAYKNFGTRISNLRKRLEDVKKTLPDPLSPIPSPTLDAPSPGDSPVDNTIDNIEAVDMELSDDHEEAYSPENAALSGSTKSPLAQHAPEDKVADIPVADVSPIVFSVDVSAVDILTPIATVSAMSTLSTATQNAVQSDLEKLSANSDIVLSLLSSLKSQPLMTEKHENIETRINHDSVTVKREVISSQIMETDKPVNQERASLESTQTLVASTAPLNDLSVTSDCVKVFSSGNTVSFESTSLMDVGKLEEPRTSIYRSPNIIGNVLPASIAAAPTKNDVSAASSYYASHLIDELKAGKRLVDTPILKTGDELHHQESALSPAYMDVADDDEGGLTPVMDEKPEMAEIPMSPPHVPLVASVISSARSAPTAESTVVSQAARVTDPIAFLNQMLSQSQPKQTGSSSSFFQSLSILTKGFPNSQVSSADSNNDDEVYIGGYIDTDQRHAIMPTLIDTDKGNKLSAVPAVGSSLTIDGSSLPCSSSPAMPPPPVPQNIVSSTHPPGELLPPPLPPALCGFSPTVSLYSGNSTLISKPSLPSPFVPASLVQSHVVPGAPQTSHGLPNMPMTATPHPAVSNLPAHLTPVTGSVMYGDNNQLPLQQMAAPPPPPPPPPPPLYSEDNPLSSEFHSDWRDASPRIEHPTVSATGRPSGSPSVSGPPGYNRHQRPGLAISCDPAHPVYDYGPTDDGLDFTERPIRTSVMQFSPGERVQHDDSRAAPNMYADRRVQEYSDYTHGIDNAAMYSNVSHSNVNIRQRGDLDSHPAWSGERGTHYDSPAHGPVSPPTRLLNPRGTAYRTERLPDYQHQQRLSRLPPPSAFSAVRGMPPGRFPRGHSARY